MSIVAELKPVVVSVLKELYGKDYQESALSINITKPEFEGDYTLVLFSLLKDLKKKAEDGT